MAGGGLPALAVAARSARQQSRARRAMMGVGERGEEQEGEKGRSRSAGWLNRARRIGTAQRHARRAPPTTHTDALLLLIQSTFTWHMIQQHDSFAFIGW